MHMFHRTLAALTVAAIGGAGLLTSHALATVAREGTIGTEFTAVFAGDLGKKPKIELRYVEPSAKRPKPPKAKVKVTAVNGGRVTFVIQAAKGGGEFAIGMKGSDQSAGSLFLRAPRVDGAGSTTVAAGGELTLNGAFFGDDKSKRNAPKVFVNGKKAKTLTFGGGVLEIQLHKKTSPGPADITVQNKIGEGTYDGVVTVTAPPKPIKGKDNVTAKIGGKAFKAVFSRKKPEAAVAVFNSGVGSLQITAAKNSGSPRNLTTQLLTIVVGVGVTDLDDLELPATFDDVGLVTFSRSNVKSSGGFPPKVTQTTTLWTSEGGTPFSVTITGWDGKRFACTFGGSLNKKAGDGAATLRIDAGSAVLEARR